MNAGERAKTLGSLGRFLAYFVCRLRLASLCLKARGQPKQIDCGIQTARYCFRFPKLASAFPKRALWNPVVDLLRHQGALNKRKETTAASPLGSRKRQLRLQRQQGSDIFGGQPASLEGQPLHFSLDHFCPPSFYLGSLCLANLCNSLYSSQVLVPGSVRDGLACLGARRWCMSKAKTVKTIPKSMSSLQTPLCRRSHVYV